MTEAPSAVVAPSRAPARTLHVGIMSRTFFYVPLWEAINRRLFESHGLVVSHTIYDSATRATESLLAGELDVALAPPEGVIRNIHDGGPLRMLAGHSGRLAHFIIAQPRFKRIQDLRGAVIGCLSLDEGSRYHIEEIMKRHGLLYPEDYELAPVGGAPTRWEKLQDGSIDAGLQSIPLNYMAEDRGFSNLGPVTDYIPEFQFTTVNAHGAWAAANADTVVRFLAVLLRMTRWMFEDRAGAEDIGSREMRVDRRYVSRAWDDFVRYGIMPADLSISDRGLEAVIGLMKQAGHLPADARIDVTRLYDLNLLERARSLAATISADPR